MKKDIRKALPFLFGSLAAILGLAFLPSIGLASKPPEGNATLMARGTPDLPQPPASSPRVVSARDIPMAARDLSSGSSSPSPSSPSPSSVPRGIKWALGSHSPNPSWSFDGKRIAYHDGVCVTIRNSDGSLDQRLRPGDNRRLDSGEGCNSPRWSRDNAKLVTSNSFGNGMLFDLIRQKTRLLEPGNNGMWSLSFTPGDSHLIGRINQTGVALVPTDRLDTVLALTTDRNNKLTGYFPSISPDGKYAVRVLGGPWDKTCQLEISRIDLSRVGPGTVPDPWDSKKTYPSLVGRQIALLKARGHVMDHSWSPDGARLVAVVSPKWYPGYDDYEYEQGELLLVTAFDGKHEYTGVRGRNPVWSPCGGYVAFDRAKGGIWLMKAAGDDHRPWRLHPGGIEPRWSPDGKKLFVLNPEQGTGSILTLAK